MKINDNTNMFDSYAFSDLAPQDLQTIKQMENQLNSQRQDDLVLIAYDKKQK